jgi:hypothetical protein
MTDPEFPTDDGASRLRQGLLAVTTAPSPAVGLGRWRSLRLDPRAVWIWVLTLTLMLYLGLDGGGYDLVVRSDAGIAVWWVLLIGSLMGLLPASRPGRAGTAAVVLFAAFAGWSTASTLWSLSSERSLDEASRLAAYAGVLWLAFVTFGERERALRHVAGALSLAIVAIAALALLGRLQPGLFSGAAATGTALPGVRARLSWPLNYWNALGALVALGLPLLLALATTARTAWARSAAAAAIPAVVLCGYLTFSRGSAIAGGLALLIFIVLSPRRIPRVATGLICAAGAAVLVAETVHRHAIENGLTTSAASTQGGSLLLLVVVVCLVVGAAQFGLTFAFDRIGRLSRLSVPVRPARVATAVAVVLVIAAAVVLGAPHRLDHAYQVFKNPNGANVHSDTIARFTALSGNGRYTYWKTAINALPGHWLSGFGVGTFQLVWLPRAPLYNYIVNAHSLYVETVTEVGLIGLMLLVAFFVTVLVVVIRAIARVEPTTRCFAAAAAAGCVAFMFSAGFDWIWQVPVVPVAFLLLVAAVITPVAASVPGSRRARTRLATRAGAVVLSAACLGLIGTPLAMTAAVRRSQADVNAGHPTAALAAARTAINIEPGAATPEMQAALVLELQGRFSDAVIYARQATTNEPQNWDAWLVRSRLEAESGHPGLALYAFDRAHSLNRESPLFRS